MLSEVADGGLCDDDEDDGDAKRGQECEKNVGRPLAMPKPRAAPFLPDLQEEGNDGEVSQARRCAARCPLCRGGGGGGRKIPGISSR